MHHIVAGVMQRRDFRLLLGGQFVSDFGGQLAIFALPTVAIFSLHAGAFEASALTGLEYAVVPLFAMLAGVFVDRWRRRRTMIAANIVRMFAVALVPLLLVSHALTMPALMALAAVAAIASLFFDTAYQPFLAGLVGRNDYERANAAMTAGATVARAVANALCGPLVTFCGAPLALIGNVATYAVGTTALGAIERREPHAAPTSNRLRDDFRGVLALLRGDAALQRLVATSSLYYFGGAMIDAVLPIYAYRTLHLSPLLFGLVLAAANFGLIGARLMPALVRGVGKWGTLAACIAAIAFGDTCCFIQVLPVAGLLFGRFIVAAASPSYDVLAQTIATARTSDAMLGRMNAAMRTVTNSFIPAGCICGGLLFAHGIAATLATSGAAFVGAITINALLGAREGKRKDQCSPYPMETSPLPLAA